MDGLTLALSLIADGTLHIDSDGRIWRCRAMGRAVAARRAENVGRKGYLRVTMGVPGERRTVSVQAHRLIWHVAKGPITEGLQINHRDFNKQNNCLNNLELVTAAENTAHAASAGRGGAQTTWTKATTYRGRRRLTAADIADIKRRRAAGEACISLGAEFNRTPGYIHDICRRGAGSRAP